MPRLTPAAAAARRQMKLVDFDKVTYGDEWLPREKRNFTLCSSVHLVWLLIMARSARARFPNL